MSVQPYTVLGVAPGATVAEIKAAYRERAREIHPDRFADDPQRAKAAHEAFVELSSAFRVALAAAAATAAASAAARSAARSTQAVSRAARTGSPGRVPPARTPFPSQLPQQRRSVPQQPPTPGRAVPRPRAVKRPTVTPVRQDDPMLMLLTVPQRCARPWSAQSLEVWALTVIPEARRHLSEAKRLARRSGVRSQRHFTTATAHAVLTLTIDNLNGPRVMGVVGQLDLAYDALEIVLPREVVDRLPARVTARGAALDAPTPDPGRRLLAFCAASGALAAVTAWTQFFGFPVG
jgi:hypothetical protein